MIFNDYVHRVFTLHKYLAYRILFFLVALLLLGVVTNTVAIVVLIIIFPLQRWGFMQAQNHYLLDLIKESNYKATLLSVRGLIEKLIAALTGSVVGMLITSGGYRLGFLLLGIISAFVLTIFYTFIIFLSRTKTKKASPSNYV